VVIIHKRAKYQGQSAVGSRTRVETDGRTDTTDCITFCTNAVGEDLDRIAFMRPIPADVARSVVFVSVCVLGDVRCGQGRLNQWAHWARAQGPRIFFLFEGPPTGFGEIIIFFN